MAQPYTGEVIAEGPQPYTGPVQYDGEVLPISSEGQKKPAPTLASRVVDIGKNVVGAYDGGAAVLTGLVAQPIAGVAGLLSTAVPGVSGADITRDVASALTYQPRTEAGKAVAGVITLPFELIQEGIHKAGNAGFEATGSPLVGAGIETGLNAALMFLPVKALKGKKPAEVKPVAEPIVKATAESAVEAPKTAAQPEPAIPITKAGKTVEATVVGDVAEPLFKAEVAPEVTKGIAGLAKQFFAENPGMRDPTRLISDDIHRYVAGGAVPEEMLAAHGLDGAKFADIWRASISDHARSLGYLSQVMREATAKMTPEELSAFQKAGGLMEDAAYVKPFWKHLTDTWRGLLVTQPVTAVRNALTQAGRVGLDVMQTPIDHWIQKLTGREVTVQPLDGFRELMSLFQKNKATTDQILSAFPKEKARLFQRYLSDVDQSTGAPTQSPVWDAIGKGVDAANILNRTQEYMIRRGIFQSALDVELRNRGLDLHDIIKNNKLGAIPDDAVHAAIDQSLSKTFAETPGWGTWQRKLIDAVNAIPGANIAIPFPRFMYNAIKFQYQYSPMGILSYLSKSERAAFAAGDVAAMSKAMIGTGLLGAAILFRNSDYAGEKWYEAVDGQGEVKDLRPFNPFASYLFAADVLKKSKDGTLYKLTAGDIAQGLLATNMRAGTGLYLLDNALNLMSKTADEKKFGTKVSELTGDFLGGFLTPLSAFRDAYDQITEGQSIARDTRGNPLVDPLKSRIPGVSQTLPEAEIPTRAGPLVTEDPLMRQLTGVTTHGKKNPVEKELDRLGFDRREVLPSTGDKPLDRKYSELMGVAVEGMMVPVVQTQRYQELPDTVQAVVLSEGIGEIRNQVRQSINQNLPPDKQLELEVKKLSPRIRILLQEFGIVK